MRQRVRRVTEWGDLRQVRAPPQHVVFVHPTVRKEIVLSTYRRAFQPDRASDVFALRLSLTAMPPEWAPGRHSAPRYSGEIVRHPGSHSLCGAVNESDPSPTCFALQR